WNCSRGGSRRATASWPARGMASWCSSAPPRRRRTRHPRSRSPRAPGRAGPGGRPAPPSPPPLSLAPQRRMRRGLPSPADAAGMEAALRLARAAAVREEVPVGAVVLRDGAPIAEAHNETIQRKDPTAHAELLALQRAMAHVGEDRLVGATLYVT